jgi:predicted GTPase
MMLARLRLTRSGASLSRSVHESWNKRVGTGLLNRWLAAIERLHSPPPVGKRAVRLKYMVQVRVGCR